MLLYPSEGFNLVGCGNERILLSSVLVLTFLGSLSLTDSLITIKAVTASHVTESSKTVIDSHYNDVAS